MCCIEAAQAFIMHRDFLLSNATRRSSLKGVGFAPLEGTRPGLYPLNRNRVGRCEPVASGSLRQFANHGRKHKSAEDELSEPDVTQQDLRRAAEEFSPRGALAFMGVLILIYAAVWFYFYSLMTSRP
jgi:hypothetical protein